MLGDTRSDVGWDLNRAESAPLTAGSADILSATLARPACLASTVMYRDESQRFSRPDGWHSRGYLPHFDGGEVRYLNVSFPS